VQLAEAVRQAAAKRQEVANLDTSSKNAARTVRDSADAHAKEVVETAEARAKALVDDAERRAAELVSDAEERLAKIRIERDTVAGYFENLRGVLSQAEKVSSES
jgi:hypothetical protein